MCTQPLRAKSRRLGEWEEEGGSSRTSKSTWYDNVTIWFVIGEAVTGPREGRLHTCINDCVARNMVSQRSPTRSQLFFATQQVLQGKRATLSSEN